jgi:hypothetical protein
MKKLTTVLTTICLSACSTFGIRSAEEPRYHVLNDVGPFQIRHYPSLVVAQTQVNADYKIASGLAFQRLAGYIFGDNKKHQALAMTAPVMQQKSATVWLMTFVLPQGYLLSTAPVPLDSSVLIQEMPDKKVATIRYTGSLSEQGIEEKSAELTGWLIQQHYQAISPPRSAAYDPPWTLPFLRRNEVHIDIE